MNSQKGEGERELQWGINPAIRRYLYLEIKTLQNATMDPDNLREILKLKRGTPSPWMACLCQVPQESIRLVACQFNWQTRTGWRFIQLKRKTKEESWLSGFGIRVRRYSTLNVLFTYLTDGLKQTSFTVWNWEQQGLNAIHLKMLLWLCLSLSTP